MALFGRNTRLGLAAAIAVVLAVGPVTEAATLQQLQQQEAQAQAQLASEQAAYKKTQQTISATLGEIAALNQQMAAANQQIGTVSQQIAAVNHNIAVTQGLIAQAQAQLTSTQQQLVSTQAHYQATTQRLAAIHTSLLYHAQLLSGQLQLIEEHGSVGYIDVVLGAHSFTDFLSRLDLLGQIAGEAAHEVQVIKHEQLVEAAAQARLKTETVFLQEAKQSILQHQAVLQSGNALLAREKAQAVALENQAVAARQQAAAGVAQHQALMSALQSQRAALASDMAALQSRIAGIVSQIQALLGQFNQGTLSRHALFTAMLPLVQPIAQQYGLSPALIIAVITQESGGNASAQSVTGAIGLMQIEPGTAQWLAQQLGQNPQTVLGELTNPQENVLLGSYYLHYLLGTYGGNTQLTLAAYNAGPGTVDYLIQQAGSSSYPAIQAGLPGQTQLYVTDVEALFQLYLGWLNGG